MLRWVSFWADQDVVDWKASEGYTSNMVNPAMLVDMDHKVIHTGIRIW